jgi:DedD protein
MEKKKLLFVVVSVGIFLVVVIGAAIVILSKQDVDHSVIARESYEPGMSGTLPPNASSIGTPAEISSTTVVPEAGTNQVNPNQPSNSTDTDQVTPVGAVSNSSSNEINIVKAFPEEKTPDSINHNYGDTNNTSDVKFETYTPEGLARSEEAAPRMPIVSKPQTPPAAPSPSQTVRTSTTVPSSRPAPAKIYNDYWVQTGSFSAKVRADNVKENLGAKGISSVIEVRNVNEQTMYRVRVGPYTSQNEAEYWLSLIRSIDGFEQSQIWQSRSTR